MKYNVAGTRLSLPIMTVVILSITFLIGAVSLSAAGNVNKLVVNVDLGTHKINKHIYDHFAEHLGRCIYGGI